MNRLIPLVALAFVAAPLVSAADKPAAPVVLKKVTLSVGNEQTHTLFVPDGWKATGGAFWAPPALFRVFPSQQIEVKAPDGREVVVGPSIAATDFLPSPLGQQQGARRPQEKTVNNGKPIIYMPQTAEQWQAFIRQHGVVENYPGANEIKMTAVEPVPALTELVKRGQAGIRQTQEQFNRFAVQNGDPTRMWCDAGVYMIGAEYTVDGKRYEQAWVWVVGVVGTDSKFGRELQWTIDATLAFRAPAGRLEAEIPLMLTVLNSVRMTRHYATLRADHIAKMNKIDREAFIKASLAQQQFSKEMRDIIEKTGQNQAAANDHAHHQFMNSLNEVSDYEVPGTDGGTLPLPIHYNHYFCDGNTLVLTNDPNIPAAQGLPIMLPATGRPK